MRHAPRIRPRGAALLLFALLALAGEAAAQEPPPPPPPPTDTVPPPPDTVPDRPAEPVADTAGIEVDLLDPRLEPGDSLAEPADTLEELRVIADFPRGAEPRWSNGVWEWDRDLIQRSAAVTLTDLLESVPGITPVRSGFYGSAESLSAFGSTAGRIEVILDGFALDPLDAGSYDLSRLELAQLNHVRVRRRGDGVRIEVETLAPFDRRPYSVVEAATGDLRTNVFRGIFMAPKFLVGPLALGVERMDTRGLFGREPANTFHGWLKWGIVGERSGLELEYRSGTIERTDLDGGTLDGTRKDWIVRARGTPTDGLTTEAFFGVSSIEDGLTGEPVEDASTQAGVRAGYSAGPGWIGAVARVRDHELLPAAEAELEAGLRLPGRIGLSGDLIWSRWHTNDRTFAYALRAEAGPYLGLSPFVEATKGTRGVPGFSGEDGRILVTDRTSIRAGADLRWGGLHLGGAAIALDADSIAGFGLGFDRADHLRPAGRIQGFESYGRVPSPRTPFAIEGSYTWWDAATSWIYTPVETGRAALVYHGFPLGHDQLEITARLGGMHRGVMRVPDLENGSALVPSHTAFDFYLQVRVLDVRAFVRWENLLHNLEMQDLPGRNYPGQRVLYGIKWQLWN